MPLEIKAKVSDTDKHAYDVNALTFHQDHLYSGADDGIIIKWDANLNKKTEVQAHESSVYSVCGMDDTIYSCSNDGSIKAWTLDLKAKCTLTTGECEYWKVVASNGVLYAGDDKGVLTTFLDDTPKGFFILLEPVKDMRVEENRIYMSKDVDVIIVTIGDGPKNTFANRKIMPGRAPLHLVGDKFAFIDRSAKGIVVHANSNELNYDEICHVDNAHEMVILALTGLKKGDDIFLYTGGWDKVIKEWKLNGDKLEQSGSCQVDLVLCTMCSLENGILYAAGSDGVIIKCQS